MHQLVEELMREIGTVPVLVAVRIILRTQTDHQFRFNLLNVVNKVIQNELRLNPMPLHKLGHTQISWIIQIVWPPETERISCPAHLVPTS